MIAAETVREIAATAAASRPPPAPAASATPPSPNSSTSWTAISMIRARVRLGKRANGTSMTTASPVITSATRFPSLSAGWRSVGCLEWTSTPL